jgi:hypothetical protein
MYNLPPGVIEKKQSAGGKHPDNLAAGNHCFHFEIADVPLECKQTGPVSENFQ